MNAAPRLAWAVATVAGLGDRLPAPGTTAGSLPAALLWWLAALAAAPAARPLLATAAVVLATAVGLWAAHRESQRRGTRDPGAVVVDEVAGQWLALLVALPALRLDHAGPAAAGVLTVFLCFRAFDVLKPWPIRRFERLPGGLGIMVDDLAAGLAAGIAALVLLSLAGYAGG